MTLRGNSVAILSLLVIGIVLGGYHSEVPLAHALTTNVPVVGVWSNSCASFVIASNNTACGNLSVGNTISVEINITNAQPNSINGYEFFLYYDPAFLSATTVDVSTGTVFSNPILVKSELAVPGQMHLAVVCLGCSNANTDGVLVSIFFKILAVGVSPISLATGMIASGFAQSFTELFTPSPLAPVTADGYFINTNGNPGPVARFAFPPTTFQGESVIFNATASYDPDVPIGTRNRGIALYEWDFGGASSLSQSTNHSTFSVPLGTVYGNFSVRLTVVDSDNSFEGMQTRLFTISLKPFHDLVVRQVTANPSQVQQGRNITVGVVVFDGGTSTESFDLSVSYSTPKTILGTANNQSIARGASSAFSFTLNTSGLAPGFYALTANVTVIPSPSNLVGVDDAADNNIAVTQFRVFLPDLAPVALFTFSPPSPVVGQTVLFDGSGSFDPDGSVTSWFWEFGDSSVGFGPVTNHVYFSLGNYTVTLFVRDNAGLVSNQTAPVSVRPRPLHDVSIGSIYVDPQVAVSSQLVFINVQISNDGLNNETVTLIAYYDSHPIQTVKGIFVPAGNCSQYFCQPTYVRIPWDTFGVSAGNYTISATIFLASTEVDPTPEDNTLSGNRVMLLQPPVLTLTPSSGGTGTKVLVQGSGFQPPQSPFESFPSTVDVTFDDMFLGFTLPMKGQFNFTFNVPIAEPGTHLVKAFTFDGIRSIIRFQVLPSNTAIEVSLNTGAIYFPGDTVTIYVLATHNGSPVSSGLQLQLNLFLPDGTKVVLSTASISAGLFKATYVIPRTESLGTYAVLATGHMKGALDGSALSSFEAKPSWLSQQGRNIIGAATIAGVIGLVAVAWQKGYLRRKGEG